MQQIERAGAPYADANVMLSLGSDLFGYGSAPTNWLWLRSFDRDESGIQGFYPESKIVNTHLAGHGVAPVYFTEGDSNVNGIWVSNGSAWFDLVDNYAAYRLATPAIQGFELKGGGDKVFYDLATLMADTPSVLNAQPLFSSEVKGTPFWMTSRYFDLELRDLIGHNTSGDSAILYGVKCFVGSITGRVCSTDEMRASTRQKVDEPHGFGYKDGAWGAPSGDSAVWPYEATLGTWTVWYRTYNYGSYGTGPWHYLSTQTKAKFWPDEDTLAYRMPVLNVAQRACTPSMVIANQGTARQNFRPVSGNDAKTRSLPSRCGTDLDYFIDRMIKRPDVPDIEALVRKPVFPEGVN